MTPPPSTDTSSQKEPRSRRRERVFAAITILASLLLVLTAAEGVTRFVKRDVAFQPDPDVVRSLRPGCRQPLYTYETEDNLHGRSTSIPDEPRFLSYGETNELGLRMREAVGPKKSGEVRVLLLGDSYTEGLEVPPADRFFEVAQRSLDASQPGTWRILNGGIQNGCPSQYVLQLERFLPLIAPDVVVVALAPNDLTDDTLFDRLYGIVVDSRGVPVSLGARTQLRLLRDVWLLRYLEVATSRYSSRLHDWLYPPFRPEVQVPDWKRVLCGSMDHLEEAYGSRTGAYLRQIKERVERTGAQLVVLLIQYEYVFPDEPFYEPRFPTLKAELRESRCVEDGGEAYNAFVERFLDESGIPYRNPRTALLEAKRADPARKLWNFYDYHFSSEGNRIVGEELADFLRARPAPSTSGARVSRTGADPG